MRAFKKICLALVIVGGINWGLYGLLRLDLVAFIFGGSMTAAARIIYSVIGVAAVCSIPLLFSGDEREDEEREIKPPATLPETYGEP